MSVSSAQTLLIQAADRATARSQAAIFRYLMPFQAAFVILLALVVLPQTWIAGQSLPPDCNDELKAAVLASAGAFWLHQLVFSALGVVLAGASLALLQWRAEAVSTRYFLAAFQLGFSAILIHITGGRIESHFHIFASLAILAFYRDLWVILVATAVAGLDHILRGYFLPLSIFGQGTMDWWHPLEHVGWVVFMDVFVVLGILDQQKKVAESAERQVEVEKLQMKTGALLEHAVGQMRLGTAIGSGTQQALQQTEEILSVSTTLVASSGRLNEAVSRTENAQESTARLFKGLQEATARQSTVMEESTQAMNHLFDKAGENVQVADAQSAALDTLKSDSRTVEKNIRQTVDSLVKLSKAGDEIRSIVEVISNVAERTQLLSLNAAIEAAHAGSAGRGFSVVAGEIRKLSEQTGKQVAQINQQVDLIVKELERANTWGREIDQRFAAITGRLQGSSEAFSLIRANAQAVSGDVERVKESQRVLMEVAGEVSQAAQASAHDQAAVHDALEGIERIGEELQGISQSLEAAARSVSFTVGQSRQVSEQLNEELKALQVG